jgi:hypothetical protein
MDHESNHDPKPIEPPLVRPSRRQFLQVSGLTAAATAFGVLGVPQLASAAVVAKQTHWRWCRRCQGLAFGGHSDQGTCPAGGAHDYSASGHYAVPHTNSFPFSQNGWRWCFKCEGMWFAGAGVAGRCPAGNGHSSSGSGQYSINTMLVQPGQVNWRWCADCQGLWFAGNGTTGVCPVGGGHDQTGSGSYCVLFAGPGSPSLSSFTMSPNSNGYWIISSGSGFTASSQVTFFLEHPGEGSISLESVATDSQGRFSIDQRASAIPGWYVRCTRLQPGLWDNQTHIFRVSDPTGRTAYGTAHLNC